MPLALPGWARGGRVGRGPNPRIAMEMKRNENKRGRAGAPGGAPAQVPGPIGATGPRARCCISLFFREAGTPGRLDGASFGVRAGGHAGHGRVLRGLYTKTYANCGYNQDAPKVLRDVGLVMTKTHRCRLGVKS